ncbi:hypothetical protein [Escherichia coli]|uniref:hypothetical protein n=1 Tax=Escherichia coli TaxID=562 RepID=UPI003F4DEEBF
MKVGKYPSGATAGAEKRPDAGGDGYRATYRRDHPGRDVAGVSGRPANGQADPFETMISWGERSISKAISSAAR